MWAVEDKQNTTINKSLEEFDSIIHDIERFRTADVEITREFELELVYWGEIW